MKTIQDTYPLFEANQVLTSHHLNQIFDYLNEQERLTRANLIGIGIECGLEIRLETVGDSKIIHLSKGCGVGSAGYILVESEDIALVSYRKYTLPVELDYPQFKYESAGKSVQFPLWEMFPSGEPNAIMLGKEKSFLDNKAVILFLELKSEGLRNCSPGNCDDKGNVVTATVRPLLIRMDDLSAIVAKANQLGTEYTATDLESVLLTRLNLPDLRLPRYNVPNTSPVSSNDVLAAFLAIFQKSKLAAGTAEALASAYKAFLPLVAETFPSDPFADFGKKFGFLDNIPASTSQVRFLPYYFDFFDDLIQAYEEFRWKGASLMCACCPPEELFPRHLMLGLLDTGQVKSPGIYRHDFLSSPAIKGCEERKAEVIQLFRRLVEMVKSFTNNPTPPEFANLEVARKYIPVRITPSKLADVPISQKAIPYYYLQNGVPPLFQLWNVEKTRRNRANQNLSFRSDEYKPKAPNFVTSPINWDLEPFNFLRIEGHLGKKVENVMNTLIAFKVNNRLPIEIIALRTGEFDARQTVDLSKEECRFEDLEAIFDAFRDEFISSLGKTLASFYAKKVSKDINLTKGFKPSLIHLFNPEVKVESSTFGAMFEMQIAKQSMTKTAKAAKITGMHSAAEADKAVNIKNIPWIAIRDAFLGESVIIQATVSYAEVLLDICNYLKDRALSAFDLAEFRDLAVRLENLNEQFKNQDTSKNNEWNDLFNLLEAVRYASQMEAFKSIGEEYRKRLIEIKKKLFLSNFLQKHPGIQHKAGVTMGGTFILVYHDDPTPIRIRPVLEGSINSLKSNFTKIGFASESSETISKAFERLQVKGDTLQVDPDIHLIISEMSKHIAGSEFNLIKGIHNKTAEKIIAETVNEFADGTVIADFYLPYICCSDCSPIQYVIPKDPLNFSVNIGCTNEKEGARIHVTPWGGTAPYKIKTDSEDFKDLKDEFLLPGGKYIFILRDSEGTLSDAKQIEIPEPLVLGDVNFDCTGEDTYVAVMAISGGSPPYSSNIGKILENTQFIGEGLPGDKDVEIIISDSRNCSLSKIVNHACIPPLSFTTSIGCTNADGNALVTINANGGKAPYEFKLDVKVSTLVSKYFPLKDPISLPAGKHSLRVRDSLGTETLPQEIEILAPLVLSEPKYECKGDKNQYMAVFNITGGQPPYDAKVGIIKETTFTSDLLPGDTDTEIVITDNRNCPASVILNHSCIPDLAFTTTIGCTSDKNVAQVQISPTGGVAPYSFFELDKPLTNPVSLLQGNHTITVVDSLKNKVSKDIAIPAALKLEVLKFVCDTAKKSYQAQIRVSGGAGSYTSNDGDKTSDNEFTTKPFASGISGAFAVTDGLKCSTHIEFTHVCEQPCKLPCDGQSRKCAYRLWIQPAADGPAFDKYQQLKDVRLRFNGKDITLPLSAELLQIPVDALNNDFANAMTNTIGKLNKAIQEVLVKELGAEGQNRLVLTYDPSDTDPFGIMWIEHLVCETFNLEFGYTYTKSGQSFNINWRYTNEDNTAAEPADGAFVLNLATDKQTFIPAFDCRERNLCKGTEYVKLCTNQNLKASFSIIRLDPNLFNVVSTLNTGIVSWVWDLMNTSAKEPFYTGEKSDIIAPKPAGKIRLTVIGVNGCFAIVENPILQ